MHNSYELRYELKHNLNEFSFGQIVKNKLFVSHFTSESHIECIDSKAVFQNDRKRVLLQFETFRQQSLRQQSLRQQSLRQQSLRQQSLRQQSLRQLSQCQQSDSGQESECNINTKPSIEWLFDKYELLINYSQIKSIHFYNNNILIKLVFPPLLYNVRKEEPSHHNLVDYEPHICGFQRFDDINVSGHNNYRNNDHNTDCINDWDNESDEAFDEIVDDYHDDVIEINQFLQDDRYEHFSGFRLRVTDLNGINGHNLTQINSVLLKIDNQIFIQQIVSNIRLFDPQIVITEESFDEIEAEDVLFTIPDCLPFNIKYSLQALTGYSFDLIDSMNVNNTSTEQMIDLIQQFCAINPTAVIDSLNDLKKSVENGLAINPYFDLIESFIRHNVIKRQMWTNDSVMFVRRCVLTPTRVLLLPALPLQQSRFLRSCNPEYAIRLLIKDEDFQLLSFSACKMSLPDEHQFVREMRDFLTKTIQNRLVNGICIGGRNYEFVGASTSQLRDHGLVLYARDDRGRDAQQICRQIGDLSGITNPAKLIARIGLSMSQSMGFVPDVNCVEMIDDITGGEHKRTGEPYIFSDGVGMISQQMASKVMSALNRSDYFPSTFQIRYAGFKGIVVMNPELEGETILMRPSMKKFNSNSTELHVLKVSEPRSVYLNRPLITILNQMGVTNEQLLRLQFDRLRELSNAFSCSCKAIKLLKTYSNLRLQYNKILESGIDVLSEPLFVNMMECIIGKVSMDLRNKARILIPLDEGRVMYGVLDETRTLQYGQVFVQYSQEDNASKVVLKGEILVTKYPCMHPGDVRKFTAIDVPSLHHIVDCIVFPSNGQRPHPDQMAGSDLDGDEYSVIWYKPFIFDRSNSEPMDFPSGQSIDLGRPVHTKDILTFYCSFVESNEVGIIASSHLAWADYNHSGIFSRICNDLNHKYAIALDYAKTGKNARLRSSEKPIRYPDFMIKSDEKSTYQSNRALGKLYEVSSYFNGVIEDIAHNYSNNYSTNELLIDPNAHHFINDAEVMFEMYKNAIIELKQQFGIESEAALISGSFTKTHKYLCTQNDNNDIHDLVSNIVNKLFNDLKVRFETGVNDEMRLAKASAWYQISVKKNNQSDDKYFGFPWIVSDCLIELANKNQSLKHDCNQYMIKRNHNLDDSLKFSHKCIESLIKRFIRHSYREDLFLGEESSRVIRYLENVMNEVLSKYKQSEIPISSSIFEIFDKLANNVEHYCDDEMVLKVGVIALMANYRVLRLGIIKSVSNEMNELSDNKLVSSVVISEKLANLIKANEQQFYSVVKMKTCIEQIQIRFGRRGQDSIISVYGTKSAVHRFKSLIIRRYICTDIVCGQFFC